MAVSGAIGLSSASAAEAAGCWRQMPGQALDIEIGADGSVWISRFRPGQSGVVARWNGSGWIDHPGVTPAFPTGFYGSPGWGLAVSPTGEPWVVTGERQIWRLVGGAWQRLPGEALSVDVGDSTVWAVGADYRLLRWNGNGWTVVDVPGGGGVGLIEADHTGSLWVQTASLSAPNVRRFRRAGDVWQEFPKNPAGGLEMYMDHDLGSDGRHPGRGLVWRTKYPNGEVESFVDGRWVRDTEIGGAYAIDVGPDGRPWVTVPGRPGGPSLTIWERTC